MRFPFSLTASMAKYLLKKRLTFTKRFPLVLMLEPLFTCNLRCAGCGRIREYADHLSERLSLQECLDSATECGAPLVSICGGEPLLYPEIGELVRQLTDVQKRHVYLCTNGVELTKHLHAETFRPSSRFFLNVHLDGMEKHHDAAAGRSGVFAAAIEGLRLAHAAGFQTCTNTTLYRESSVDEIVDLCHTLQNANVGGLMLAPAFSYETFDETCAEKLFLQKEETHQKFQELEKRLAGMNLTATPLYRDFLAGRRTLPCAAWANPTRNVCGWKAPCYLLTDAHYPTYREMLKNTKWETLGPEGTDPRCQNCMMHCGFEPGAVLVANRNPIQGLRLAWWQLFG
ncbi:MAG: adenosyl-hopene transferase HpnH [Planctomycetia bacterium]|nr:adenosyl-hopene transferase HpnH [Planctomycetia bacterium]